MASSVSPLDYIRTHPFSTMALCNMMGDVCWLGFAFAADGFVSFPKLAGASFTMMAHILLLAYGDDQARQIASEAGLLSRVVLRLRRGSQNIAAHLPLFFRNYVRRKPVGVSFSMLAVNGIGLCIDAGVQFPHHPPLAMMVQALVGSLVTFGTGAFAGADFVRSQREADRLTKIAPSLLLMASLATVVLAVTTENAFIIASVFVFATSNIAGFYTRIDKG